jgi:hypothetical protein
MAVMVKAALTAIVVFTLAATVFLSLSLAILRPPRANYQMWFVVASLIVTHGAITLAALWTSGPKGLRLAAMALALALAVVGAQSVDSTLSGPHFEGYALVLGSAMIVQGLLALLAFAGFPDRATA